MTTVRARIDVNDFDRQVTASVRTFERLATDALYSTAAEAASSAKQTTLFKNITGKLRGSITSKPRTFFLAQLQANTKYASYVHDGTRPHTITAKDGGILRFQVAGRWVSKSSVAHPGTTARPFLQIAAEAHEAILASRLERASTAAFG